MNTWFFADPHLGHEKILGFEPMRGALFKTIEEHDECILDLWRDRVKKRDVVYLLGDIAANKASLAKYKGLPGLKQTHLILGNHDKLALPNYQELFCSVSMFKEWEGILLTHFPVHAASVRPRYRGNFFGHQHGTPTAAGRYHACICPEVLGDMGPVTIDAIIPFMGGFEKKCSWKMKRRRK